MLAPVRAVDFHVAKLWATPHLKDLNIPLGFPHSVADWRLVLWFIIPLISEFPTVKVVQHLRGRLSSRHRSNWRAAI